MNLELPDNLEEIKNAAIENFWTKSGEAPDLTQLQEWLEDEGWNIVVSGMYGQCLWVETLADQWFYDQAIIEDSDIKDTAEITDQNRIQHAKKRAEYAHSESDDTVHLVELSKSGYEPVYLVCLVLGRGQGGWEVEWEGLFANIESYLSKFDGMLLLGKEELTDFQILSLWQK